MGEPFVQRAPLGGSTQRGGDTQRAELIAAANYQGAAGASSLYDAAPIVAAIASASAGATGAYVAEAVIIPPLYYGSGAGSSSYVAEAMFCTGDNERLAPDAILELDNLAGMVSDIQDDPDSPDGSWLTAIILVLRTSVRVSFATPSTPIPCDVLQEFKALVRPTELGVPPPARLVAPAAALELWENGVFLDSSTFFAVVSEEVIAWHWDPTLLTDPTGAGVECRINGIASEVDNVGWTVEVGAIEWNVASCAGCRYAGSAGASDGHYTPDEVSFTADYTGFGGSLGVFVSGAELPLEDAGNAGASSVWATSVLCAVVTADDVVDPCTIVTGCGYSDIYDDVYC